MATAAARPGRFATLADLQEFLGHIPSRRIRLNPPPGLATEQDLLDIHQREGRICELIDGVLVEKAVATFEARLAGVLIFFIEAHPGSAKLGAALPGDGFLRLFPGRVRAPDVSFIRWKDMPGRRFPREKIASLTPDLAVEVLSEGNTEAEMDRKLREYFESGTRLVWLVDPDDRSVRVYTSPRKPTLLSESESLSGGKVLPGFVLSIRTWFERAESGG